MPGEGVSGGGGTECDKVVRSLISGFPNEVDFALNVLTIMSFNKPAALPVAKVTHMCMWYCSCILHNICESQPQV